MASRFENERDRSAWSPEDKERREGAREDSGVLPVSVQEHAETAATASETRSPRAARASEKPAARRAG